MDNRYWNCGNFIVRGIGGYREFHVMIIRYICIEMPQIELEVR